MMKIRKKIPNQYQKVIKEFYGRQRMIRLCKGSSLCAYSLLRFMGTCQKEGLTVKNIHQHKVISKWGKGVKKLTVEYETIPKAYAEVISRHFSMRKAKQVCILRDLNLFLFVRLLESCWEQKVGLWDLSTRRIDLFPVEVPRSDYLSESTILSPVFEFP
jgi:hypothetical protein